MKNLYLLILVIPFIAACSTAADADSFVPVVEKGLEIHLVESDGVIIESGMEYPPNGIEQKGIVLFSQGSGNGEMNHYMDGFYDRYLRNIFLEQGIAIVYTNKRGIGRSTGTMAQSSIEQRALDLLSVLDYFQKQPNIKTDITGLVGHSQGGWVVMEAAGRNSDLDFVISLAGPSVSVAESDLDRTRLDYLCQGYTGEELEKKVNKRQAGQERMVRIGSWFPFFELGYMHNILPYRPDDALKASTVPMLLAYGELDNMARAEQSVDRLNEIFPGGLPENITVHVEESTDHFFHLTDNFCFDYMASKTAPYSDDFLAAYRNWLEEQVF